MSRLLARIGMPAVVLALVVLAPTTPARADGYPSRPITIIVSLAAGTGMDTLVRASTARSCHRASASRS